MSLLGASITNASNTYGSVLSESIKYESVEEQDRAIRTVPLGKLSPLNIQPQWVRDRFKTNPDLANHVTVLSSFPSL
jgi:hypothetical protein